MPAPSPVRQAAAARSTYELPFAVPDKEWFTIAETARAAGMSERYTEDAFDEGKILSGHLHNAKGAEGARMTKRIPRVWLIAFLATTAAYELPTLADALERGLRNLSTELLLRLRGAIERELRRRQ